MGAGNQQVLNLSPETDVSPRTGLKDVPGAISARLEPAPCKEMILLTLINTPSKTTVGHQQPQLLQKIEAASWVRQQ